jgi:esterase
MCSRMSESLLKLFHKTYGDGPPILLLHGLLGSSDNWHTIAGLLSDRYRVITADLRNHGRSPHAYGFTYQLLAEDVHELIEDLKLTKPIVVGHSMGGKAAMELALRYPDLLQGIVVEDMIPGETTAENGRFVKALLGVDPTGLDSRKQVEELLSRDVENRVLLLFLLKNLRRNTEGSLEWRVNLRSLDDNYREIWKQLDEDRDWDGPALFIRGGRSRTVPGDRLEELFAYFPKAKIVTVERAGHWVHADALAEFLIHARQFLDEVSGSGSH